MGKAKAKFIEGIDKVIAALFAPAITDGQQVTCYVDEEMTPYTIQGDNIPVSSSGR